MTIGQLADNVGVNVDTIRYYERIGVLDAPPRTPSGYRQYSHEAGDRLQFIKRTQRLGFTLAEIQELLALHFNQLPHCDDVHDRILGKVEEVDQKIEELTQMRSSLMDLAAQCRSECDSACDVLIEAPPA